MHKPKLNNKHPDNLEFGYSFQVWKKSTQSESLCEILLSRRPDADEAMHLRET